MFFLKEIKFILIKILLRQIDNRVIGIVHIV